MGTDIHVRVERFDEETSKWGRVRPPLYRESVPEDFAWAGMSHDYRSWWEPRHYGMFGILAGIRGGNFDKVRRGLPDDMDRSYDVCSAPFDPDHDSDVTGGDHSFTWYSVMELMDVDGLLPESDDEFDQFTSLDVNFTNDWIDSILKHLEPDVYANPDNYRVLIGFDS
jgi:hypothetical protein